MVVAEYPWWYDHAASTNQYQGIYTVSSYGEHTERFTIVVDEYSSVLGRTTTWQFDFGRERGYACTYDAYP